MQEGTVKFFNQNKSYGFIAGDDGKDYFVHSSGIAEGIYIKDGDKVSFEVVDGDKGPKADKVEIIDQSINHLNVLDQSPICQLADGAFFVS